MTEENNKKSAWQKYKESLGDTRPWDFMDPNTSYVEESVSKKRLDICIKCPEFFELTKQGKKCGCFMVLKTKLQDAECPLGKWGKE
jgi:hypothetical protein